VKLQDAIAFSPPYYPSPWASGKGEWATAYLKARQFVSQLTLLEKVNLTTGVGYVSFSHICLSIAFFDGNLPQ
jgi:beta-glucosidase